MEKKRKTTIIKRIVSCVSALALSVVMLGDIPVSADDTQMYYQYPLFAYSSEEGAITSNASVFCVNGNIATNGTIKTENTININGQKKEKAEETMPDISLQVNEKFFTKNAEVKVGDYSVSETNINLSESVDVKGKVTLKGNTIIGSGIKAMGNVDISGGTLHGENTVLFSEQGSIMIESDSVTLKGLIYAPQGDIIINAKSLSVDNVVMIANKITLNAPNININSNAEMAKFVQEAIDKNNNNGSGGEEEPVTDPAIYAYGEYNEKTKSVDIEWYSNVTGEFAVLESMNGTDYTVVSKISDNTKYSINVASDFIKKYFKVTTIKDGKTIESIPFSIVNANGKYTTELLDTDTDGLADLYEEMLGTDKTVPDTDKDGLTDYEEAYITSTAPTKYDSVTDGVSDANADNDKDGLTNKREIELKTDPNSEDTDGDTLKDGDEVSKYNTDPTKRDTDGDELEDDDEFKFNCDPNKKDTDNNGIIDGKEKHQQTLDVVPDNKEQAVSKVSVSMSATGNIEKTTTVESIMNKDMLCSRVVGLVGEPFSIESSSSFDKATITFTVDKAKLGETKFDDLMFLWYDRENDNFVELDTTQDAANSTVSIETTHFSDYMIVDSAEWWHNWERIYEDAQKYSSGDQTSKSTATVLYIKCSDKNDPGFINPDEHNTTVFHNTTLRDMVFEHLISLMDKDDVISFADNNGLEPYTGWGYTDFLSDKTEIKKEYKKHLNYSGGSGELYSDIVCGSANLAQRNLEDKQKRIIYIADHDVKAVPEFHDKDYDSRENFKMFYKSVPVYFVCIGDFAKPNLEKVASDTDGKVYTAATLNELYSQLDPNIIHPGAKHSDSDGFSDDEEIYGLIVDSSGTRYKTNPKKDDTDGDDLKDNEEVEVKRSLEKGKDKYGKEVYKWYHHMKSDPTKQDSDKDGINDKDDTLPLDYSSKYGSIYYVNKEKNIASWYYIEVPNHIDTQYERIWELEDEVIKSDYDMTWIKYLSGVSFDNDPSDVKHKDLIAEKTLFKLTGLGVFTGFLSNTDNLAEDFSMSFKFEKSGDMHRVIISAGSKSTRDLYKNYANDIENSLYINQNRNPFGEYEVSKAVMNLYKKIAGKSLPDGDYDLRVTCDSKHRGEKYTSYLWINKDGKIMEKPKLYANDKVSIGRIKGWIIQDYEKILDLKIDSSVEASEMYQNLFKRIEYKDVLNGTLD